MTDEELVVLDSLVTELIEKREQANTFRTQRDEITAEHGLRVNEKARLMEDLNRLRESEANALNAAEEAKRERDEARKKLGDAARYIDQHYRVLLTAVKTKDCRSIVRNTIASMKDYFSKNKVVYIEGGMAK